MVCPLRSPKASLVMRYLIGLVLLSVVAPALAAEIYECVGANGSLRYTKVISPAKGCKVLNASPDTFPAAEARAKVVATPPKAELAALTAAHDSPDPAARLQVIEDWARGSPDSLDPVTYALVDPNESVRARAQELWEEALKRR
jgi:Domain of unknown function (DUF4124)